MFSLTGYGMISMGMDDWIGLNCGNVDGWMDGDVVVAVVAVALYRVSWMDGICLYCVI